MEVNSHVQFSNTFRRKTGDRAEMVIDQERADVHLVVRYGLSEVSDVTLDAAYVWDSKSGVADRLIRDFHQALGTNEGNRATHEADRYEYVLADERTGRAVSLTDPPRGAGEPVLTYRRRQRRSFALWWWEDVVWGWRLAAKLPLGDDSPAIASGEPDLGGGVMFDGFVDTAWGRIGMFGNLGIAYLSPAAAAVFPTRRWVPMATAGLAVSPTERLTLVLQSQLAGARYADAPIALLNHTQNILLFGAQYRRGGALYSFGFTEDPNTTSEDVGVLFGFTGPAF